MFTDVIRLIDVDDAIVVLIREGQDESEERAFGLRLDPKLVNDDIMPNSRKYGFFFNDAENVTTDDVVAAYVELLDARLASLNAIEKTPAATAAIG